MTGRIVRYADAADTIWANGGGTTRLMWSDANEGRRISVATLTKPGAFSLLPSMLRTLVVLDRLQVVLEIDDRTVELRQGDMLSFFGEQPATLLALDRPGRVLNVMARMDRWKPHVSRDAATAELIGWVAADAMAWNDNALHRGDLVLGVAPPSGMLAIAFRSTASSRAL